MTDRSIDNPVLSVYAVCLRFKQLEWRGYMLRFDMVAVAAIIAVCGILAGCATITKGTTQPVAISTPGAQGASCTLTSPAIGSQVVQMPATLTLDKSQKNINVVCKKACFEDAVGVIPSHAEGMTAGNVVVGGVVGLGVDAISGAMNKYNDNNQFTMVPIAGCTA